MKPLNSIDKIQTPIEDIKLEDKVSEVPIVIQFPLHVAIESNDIELVKRLLESADIVANINAKNEKDESPLYVAVSKGSEEIVKRLLQHEKIKVDIFNNEGRTPLLIAVVHGFVSIAKILIHNGADVNHVDKKGASVLLYAVLQDHEEAIKLLVRHGADMNFKFKDNVALLTEAVLEGKTKSVQALIECGADIHCVNNKGYNLLYFAVFRENIEMVQLLVKLGLNVNCINDKEHTPLHHFILTRRKFNKEFFKGLIKCGLDIERSDAMGCAPLPLAVCYGNEEMVIALLENGADINIKSMNGSGRTALSLAKDLQHGTKIHELLAARSSTRTKIEASSCGFLIAPYLTLLDTLWALMKSIYKTVFAIANNVIKFVCKQANMKPLGNKEELECSQSKTPRISTNPNDDYAKTTVFASYLCQYFMNSRQNLRFSKLLSNSVNLTNDEISKFSSQVFKFPGLKFCYSGFIVLSILSMINSSVEYWNKAHDVGTPIPSKYTYAKNGVYIAIPPFFLSGIISHVVHAWDITPQLTDYKISQFIKRCCIDVSSRHDILLTKTFIPESICAAALCLVGFLVGNAVDKRSSNTKAP